MPTLHAVTECFGLAARETWVDIPEPRPPYIRLWSRTEPEEVALLVALLCTYNSPPDKRHGASLDELLALHDVAAPGGLAAVAGDVFIPPSCCCGLESWREWLRFVDGGEQPWLGHNPSPWVETTGSSYVVWSDGGK